MVFVWPLTICVMDINSFDMMFIAFVSLTEFVLPAL